MNEHDRELWGAQWPGGGALGDDWQECVRRMRQQGASDHWGAAAERAATTAPATLQPSPEAPTPAERTSRATCACAVQLARLRRHRPPAPGPLAAAALNSYRGWRPSDRDRQAIASRERSSARARPPKVEMPAPPATLPTTTHPPRARRRSSQENSSGSRRLRSGNPERRPRAQTGQRTTRAGPWWPRT